MPDSLTDKLTTWLIFRHQNFKKLFAANLIMCFSPQRRATFRYQNFKKCSEDDSFSNIFTSKCAFRHSGMQFSTSKLQKLLPEPHFFAFWLLNGLLATAACNLQHQNLKKRFKNDRFWILTSKCAFQPDTKFWTISQKLRNVKHVIV